MSNAKEPQAPLVPLKVPEFSDCFSSSWTCWTIWSWSLEWSKSLIRSLRWTSLKDFMPQFICQTNQFPDDGAIKFGCNFLHYNARICNNSVENVMQQYRILALPQVKIQAIISGWMHFYAPLDCSVHSNSRSLTAAKVQVS